MPHQPKIEIGNGEVEVDALIVAQGLGITPDLLRDEMRAGKVTSRLERGVGDDEGRHRLTFFADDESFSLIVDDEGRVIKSSAVKREDPQSAEADAGASPIPGAHADPSDRPAFAS
jgi:hypothetical protein